MESDSRLRNRGIYIRNCLCSLGGKAFAFRAPDGICITYGGGEQSITDETLYNLFPHENSLRPPSLWGRSPSILPTIRSTRP